MVRQCWGQMSTYDCRVVEGVVHSKLHKVEEATEHWILDPCSFQRMLLVMAMEELCQDFH